MPHAHITLKYALALIVSALLLAACATQKSEQQTAYEPLETDGHWIWSNAKIESKLKDGSITQERANKTLAADGGVCAAQASQTPVQTATCKSQFVFECVDLPQAALTGCTTAVRGKTCSADDMSAIHRVQDAAFINCMHEIGWQRHRAGG